MTEEEIRKEIRRQRHELADWAEGLSPEQWESRSLCTEWRVRDVIAHVPLATEVRWWELFGPAIRARGDLNVIIRDAAREKARLPYERLVADMRRAAESRRLAPTTTVYEALTDVLVHWQDVTRPLGQTRETPAEAARAGCERLWARKRLFHPRKDLAGYRLVATDTTWTEGEGRLIEAPTATLLLLLTGRLTPESLIR
ncbi:maleylpyruvate isomerase family mycothiol-dependent enzyme [Nonomuraea sp. NPDC050328]|uniref:maleylpyruvate isomerase family mycothiol-dependent enzyme n=1 Tax=Nonomuraea sp. NPDC050328 TaxID=3364361 RepID=UPI0037B8EB5C